MNDGYISYLVPFDMSNAFNSVHINDLCKIMDEIHYKIGNIFNSYLRNRKIIVGRDRTIETTVGVPQRSSAGPILWLLIMNEFMNMIQNRDKYELIAFADDLLLIIKTRASFITGSL